MTHLYNMPEAKSLEAVILNLENVQIITSMEIGALIACTMLAHKRGLSFKVQNLQQEVNDALKICNYFEYVANLKRSKLSA